MSVGMDRRRYRRGPFGTDRALRLCRKSDLLGAPLEKSGMEFNSPRLQCEAVAEFFWNGDF